MKKRLRLIIFIALGLMIFLSVVVIIISNRSGDSYNMTILKQQDYTNTTIPFRRGTITDRNGTVLATSERVYILILDPSVILANNAKNEEATLSALVSQYGFEYADVKRIIEENPKRAYIRYKKNISEDEKTAFENYKTEYNKSEEAKQSGKVVGVWYEQEYKRVYPFDNLACTVLGFSGTDSSRGNWGIEEYYNQSLIGTNGREYGYMNSDGVAERNVIAAEDGSTVVSTIDYTIQGIVESKIADFLKEYHADNVAAIVMNPKNGEILGLATDKTYNLNDPSNLSGYYTEEELDTMTEEQLSAARAAMWKNFAVQDAYEPGSTAKPFTVSMALEEKAVTKDSTYLCEGEKSFGREGSETIIHCNKTHGNVTLTESLMYSCNSAMMDIASALGKDIFSKYQTVFGFGRQTGIDLPGETAGLLYTADNMGPVDLASNSFGQNFNANMIQMAAGFASVINGGYYYQPHIVKQILASNGQVKENIEPTLVRRTISEDTSEFIKNALFMTIEEGTGLTAQITGYDIGGKTGTAEKHPRSDKKYLVSFIAAAPIEDPEILIYVIVDNPSKDGTEDDGTPSAKLAISIERNIMEAIIPYISMDGEGELVPQHYDPAEPAAEPGRDDREQIFDDEQIPRGGYLDYDGNLPQDNEQ